MLAIKLSNNFNNFKNCSGTAQKVGLAILNLRYRYVVQVCGTGIWYVVQPYQACGTGMWYRYVVQVCGTGIWYSLIRYVVQVCGTALSGKIWAQLKFQTQQDHHNLDAVCLHVRVLPMSASPCNRSI